MPDRRPFLTRLYHRLFPRPVPKGLPPKPVCLSRETAAKVLAVQIRETTI